MQLQRRLRDRDHEQKQSQLQQRMSQETAHAARIKHTQSHKALDEAILCSLPSDFAGQGLDTRAELQARWPGMALPCAGPYCHSPQGNHC
ncbi:hypothetical protein WJX84_002940 [Apatococcus fuscideae]|uniref:Uncharacterized protein n=1 Tax=Apatococcus fuscideae TaxID=2026836 RepID=A0AAW1SRY6_9CHLO